MIYTTKPVSQSPAAQFVAWAESYYGRYPEGQRADIAEYLAPWDESYLVALKECVKRTYSSQYGKPPDVSVFDGLYSAAMLEKEKSTPTLPAPPLDVNETDFVKAKRLTDDMKAAGVMFQTPDWFGITFRYRQKRGDYRKDDAKYIGGGLIHNTAEAVSPEPFTTGLPDFGARIPERAATTWEELGGAR